MGYYGKLGQHPCQSCAQTLHFSAIRQPRHEGRGCRIVDRGFDSFAVSMIVSVCCVLVLNSEPRPLQYHSVTLNYFTRKFRVHFLKRNAVKFFSDRNGNLTSQEIFDLIQKSKGPWCAKRYSDVVQIEMETLPVRSKDLT